MIRLVYGVGLASGNWHRPLPDGPMGSVTRLLCEGELTAAYSDFAAPAVNPPAAYLLDYARVIDLLHRRGPFLPMRFPCLLSGKSSIHDLLRTRSSEFLAALEEVTGCDEFGLRILALGPDLRTEEPCPRQSGDASASAPLGAGARYLAARRESYARRDARRDDAEEIAKRYGELFQGLYSHCQRGADSEHASMISLCFLVRRERQSRFRKVFRDVQQTALEKLLLTGPWPPYAFAATRCLAIPAGIALTGNTAGCAGVQGRREFDP